MELELPLNRTLKNGMLVAVDGIQDSDQAATRSLFNRIVAEGLTYPQRHPLTASEFAAYWMSADAFVVRPSGNAPAAAAIAPSEPVPEASPKPLPQILGAFYLKPNFPGRSSHICNAGFIVQPELQGLGIGRLMGEAMLAIAADKGYKAVMFNLIYATNLPSLTLWDSLGFTRLGQIPNAAELANGQVVDAVIMYRALV